MWLPVAVYGPVTVCGCVWLWLAVCGCLWLPVAVCGCLWPSVAVCGCLATNPHTEPHLPRRAAGLRQAPGGTILPTSQNANPARRALPVARRRAPRISRIELAPLCGEMRCFFLARKLAVPDTGNMPGGKKGFADSALQSRVSSTENAHFYWNALCQLPAFSREVQKNTSFHASLLNVTKLLCTHFEMMFYCLSFPAR